jgi:hypothetical protein
MISKYEGLVPVIKYWLLLGPVGRYDQIFPQELFDQITVIQGTVTGFLC